MVHQVDMADTHHVHTDMTLKKRPYSSAYLSTQESGNGYIFAETHQETTVMHPMARHTS